MGLIMTAKKLTAEELAVKMEMGNHDWADDAADMLRQQQAEIESLKQQLELATWDEDAWKRFKKDNYEVINLGHIKESE